ncbi:Siderophore synthetase component [Halanaeroarchaeum sp. HSR-CO]|uniref:IucA/IucC family protein n=1 Tax=Halanaeroarchaeum sp. HSR-CO TaxID=2866382 RepID=UPI00217E39B9|nr:IucA/IucC family protein [Halanaeroarchaeum sp. HSR-CO]UWG46596.1 Siderophore synthetase component [Halanaeroarchaeum sp. HSR-CO]
MTAHENGGPSSPTTAVEWEALPLAVHYANANDLPGPADARFFGALDAARTDIVERLVRGVVRGAPAGLETPVRTSPSAPTIPDRVAPADVEVLATVVRALEPSEEVVLVPFPASDGVLVAPVAAVHGFDRYRFAGPIRHWTPGDGHDPPTVDRPAAVIDLLEREGAFIDDEQVATMRAEVAESVANLALAHLAATVQGRTVTATEPGAGAAAIADGIHAASRSAAFERIVTDGHPFHPSAKIRHGMSAADGLAYAAEFTGQIDVRFVGIRRDVARETRATGARRFTERLFETFDGLRDALAAAVPGSAADYAVVPVHPWQYYHTVQERYADQRRDGRVVVLPEYSRPATPQLNLRTVVPFEADDQTGTPPHVKLAIDVQTTNVVRTLSPNAVTNGPQITDLLRAVVDRASFERLGLLDEPAATGYFAPGGPHREGPDYDDARHLAGLLRESPESHPLVTTGTTPIVAASLPATVPGTDRPLVVSLVDRLARATETTSRADAARAFLTAYADVVIPDQLELLTRYGIALESHLQNSLIVVDEGRPIATLVRDFGGIRVHADRLADHGLGIDPYPDSDVDADDEADLHRKLYYALYQNHLAEVIATLAHETDVEEATLWEIVRERTERTFAALRTAGVPTARVDRDEAALFAEESVHKALTAMRLQGKRHEYVTSRVANPLAER